MRGGIVRELSLKLLLMFCGNDTLKDVNARPFVGFIQFLCKFRKIAHERIGLTIEDYPYFAIYRCCFETKNRLRSPNEFVSSG